MPESTILISHALRSYRETLASWLRVQRLAVCVAECDPAAIDLACSRYAPFLVICDVPSPTMRHDAAVLSWIELHPPGGRSSVVHLPTQEWTAPQLSLPDILAVADAAERAALERHTRDHAEAEPSPRSGFTRLLRRRE